MFSVSVSSPLPFIRSYTIEFYISVSAVPTPGHAPGAPPTLLRGKLGAVPPGPTALLPRTGPSSNGMNDPYGHGVYGNGTATATRQRYGNGFTARDTECWKSGMRLACVCGLSLQPIGCTSALACDEQRYGSCSCR